MSDFLGSAPRPVEASIKEKLTTSLQPQLLQVINESHMHAVPKNSETHFKVLGGNDNEKLDICSLASVFPVFKNRPLYLTSDATGSDP